MYQGNGADIKVEVETTTKIVIYGIKGDIEDLSGRWTGSRGWREKRLSLAAETDGQGIFGATEPFAENHVFDNYAEGGKIEDSIKSSAGGAVSMVEDV